MLNTIWPALFFISFICSIFTGKTLLLPQAFLQGTYDAILLTIRTAGMLCFWSGLLEIARVGGLTQVLARAGAPVLQRLFPKVKRDSEAMQAICLNLTANILGLGNAATPCGLKAMQALATQENGNEASDAMVLFVVLNTTSLQLVPTYIGTLRAQAGAAHPFDIVPAVWIAAGAGLLAALCIAKCFGHRGRHHG